MTIPLFCRLTASTVGILLLLTVAAAAVPAPTDQVRTTVDKILQVLRDDQVTGEEQRQQLTELIRARFNFHIMAQRTLGQHWHEASPQQQERFVDLFTDLLKASYLGRIEAYTDEEIIYLGERRIEDRAEVKTSVKTSGGKIPIDYRLVLLEGEWLVYDVIVENVSLIKNYRSSYGQIVSNEGFSGLFERMETKIRELRQSTDKSS